MRSILYPITGLALATLVTTAAIQKPVAGKATFERNVLPVLMKAGCAGRACHAADNGQNGFKLSLFNYDPSADASMMAQRVNPNSPEESLLLKKPTLSVSHGGGHRFSVGSPEYQSLLDWIRAGAPGPSETDPRLEALSITPATVRLAKAGEETKVRVTARFSDGAQQDVTDLCTLSITDPDVANLGPGGGVRSKGRGDCMVVARYPGALASSAIACDAPLTGAHAKSSFTPTSSTDKLLAKRWERLGIIPAGRCTDGEYIRRVYLDLLGALPTPDETRAFLSAPDRRKLAESLLARPEFADRWTQWWGDMLRLNSQLMSQRGAMELQKYLRASIQEKKPISQMARELIAAEGRSFRSGPPNYYGPVDSIESSAATTSRVFMGVRLECAQCHNHPYEKWSQVDFYRFAGLWSGTFRRRAPELDEINVVEDRPVPVRIEARVGKPGVAPGLSGLTLTSTLPMRAQFAEWLTAQGNPYFARAFVNKVWAQFMGRGFFDPVDDYRESNPPVTGDALAALAEEFAVSGFDFHKLVLSIVTSSTYQLSSVGKTGGRLFSQFAIRRLNAEAMVDAICQVTGVPEQYADRQPGTKAMQLLDSTQFSRFLDLFGRPKRQEIVCERSMEPNLSQALFLMNNGAVQGKIASDAGTVVKIALHEPKQAIGELYLMTLCRTPTSAEMNAVLPLVTGAKNRRQALEDVLWAIINSREFQFQH